MLARKTSLVETKGFIYVPVMEHDGDIRRTRLFDLTPDERVQVQCQCGSIVEFPARLFPVRYRTPSDTLVYDLQFKLKCRHCSRRSGFEISIMSRRTMGSSSDLPPYRVVVPFPDDVQREKTARRLTLVKPEPDD
jgi:hypothetical protein